MKEEEDDEFSYAFEGKPREGTSCPTVPEFMPVELPQHLVTDLRQQELVPVVEDQEEEEDDTVSHHPAPGIAGHEDKQEHSENPGPTGEESSSGEAMRGGVGSTGGGNEKMREKGVVGKVVSVVAAPMAEREAEREWEEVMQVREQEMTAGEGALRGTEQAAAKKVTYAEAETYFEGMDLSSYKESIILHESQLSPRAVMAGIWSCFGLLAGPFLQEKVQIFCLAKLQFSDSDAMHACVLHSIYMALTGVSHPMPRFGHHWDDIGFQGTDPATDLRGGGMLGLLQLLHLTDCHTAKALTMWHLSRDEVQGYPFAIVSINITKWALEALRSNLLSRPIQQHGCVLKVLNAFYVGAFLEFHARWKGGHKTMADSGFILHELEKSTKRNACKIVRKASVFPNNKLTVPGTTLSADSNL